MGKWAGIMLYHEEFGAKKVPAFISYLRDTAYRKAQTGKKRNIYSHIVRTYSKLFRRPFDVIWEGINMRVHPNENSGDRWIFRVGLHSEYEDLHYLKTLYAGKNLSVIDIGANIGVYTLYLSKILGANSRIICFEPHPYTYSRLMANISFNPNPNIIPVNTGVGDKSGSAWLYSLNYTNAGENSLRAQGNGAGKVEVQIRTLAEVVAEKGVKNIDFLKIDIEGFEDKALIPFMESCSQELLPKHIFIEDNRAQWESDCFQYFLERGYEITKSHKKNGNSHFMVK